MPVRSMHYWKAFYRCQCHTCLWYSYASDTFWYVTVQYLIIILIHFKTFTPIISVKPYNTSHRHKIEWLFSSHVMVWTLKFTELKLGQIITLGTSRTWIHCCCKFTQFATVVNLGRPYVIQRFLLHNPDFDNFIQY
jgi:hypothetical protein